jgi:D-cysteine desulfhydrase
LKAIKKYNLPTKVTEDDIHLIDGYVGKGYEISSEEEIDLIKEVA